jgi:hypothetical protein
LVFGKPQSEKIFELLINKAIKKARKNRWLPSRRTPFYASKRLSFNKEGLF